MLAIESKVRVADNSGAKNIKIIKALGSSEKKKIYLNNIVVVVVQNLVINKRVQKKKIYYGLVLSTKYKNSRKDGSFIKFDRNRIILFSLLHKFLGTRLYGPICKELKRYLVFKSQKERFQKIISHAKVIL
jgi:large subunit ribosomal protein L14